MLFLESVEFLITLHMRSVRIIFYEREGHDVTTTKIHPTASGRHASSFRAWWCVPDGKEAFFETR
ncbi:MAG: hypothetical protein ACJ8BW_03770, partial [Ktedonobacteraceae bacterium]